MAEDRYVLEKKLGVGGMGEVWLAKDTLLNRPVAVKFLQAADNPMYKDLFLSEARTLASLQHPQITLIYDAVFDEGENRFYIMMEYVEGKSLKDLIQESSVPLPLDMVIKIAVGVLEALNYAHRKKIVHRDIKPDNIVIQGETVKLTDFGLATLASLLAQGQPGFIVGTPAYMSPEQIGGEGIDGRADLYSLGVTLFEMLSGGKRPFEYADRRDMLMAHIEEEPPSVRQFNPTVPLTLVEIISKLLAKHPDDRYDSAQVLLDLFNAMRARRKFSRRYRQLREVETKPLLGRADELSKIKATWEQVQETNSPRLMVVRGEMGIGKSRLIGEFLVNNVIDRGAAAAIGRCDELGAPYTPFAEIFAAIFDQGLVKQTTLESHKNRFLEQIPGLASLLNIERSRPPAEKKPKALSSGLWKTLGDRVPGNVSDNALQTQWQFFSVVSNLLAELGPTTLFLDEAAYLDESSLALVNFLLQQGESPIFIVAECRDSHEPIAWLEKFAEDDVEIMSLAPLPAAAIKSYVGDLLDGPVADAAVNMIEKRGRGNPFHLEEITRQLVESGDLFQGEDGEWRYQPPPDTGDLSQDLLSPFLANALTRRLEKLTPKSRELLTLAAIIEAGPEFDFEVWLALLGGKSHEVAAEEALNEALQRRLLRASGHHRYIFRPVDVAKSLADSLPPPRRRELHQKIANILIEMQGDPLQIGYHYEQAGLSGEAAQYLAQAGARAMAANAINQAIKCYRRAVELVESQSSYEALGNLHRQQGAWSESVNAFKQALEMAQKSGDVDKQAQLQNNLAFTLWLADEYKEASDYASEVLKVERVSPIEQATAQSHLGMIAWVLGHFREAENWCQKAVAMLTESGDEARLAGAYNRLGLVYFSQGKFAEAAQLTQQALATREKFDDRWGKAYCLVSLGRIAAEQGNFESATTHFTQAQELFETIGSNDGLLVVYTEQGRTQLLQGAAGEAMPLLSQALQLAQNLGKRSAYSMGDIYLLIAQANLKQGQIDRAKASMDSALKLVESAGNQAFVAAGRALMAQIYTAQNKPAPADKMYQAAIGLFEKVGNPAGLLRTKVAYARFLAGQGKSDIAATMEQEARSQAESIGLYI